MGFLTGGGTSSSSSSTNTNVYLAVVDNGSFVSHGDIFKVKITHNLKSNNLYVAVHDGAEVVVADYKVINDNEIEVYYKVAKDVNIMIVGFGKVNSGEKSIIGIGEIGKLILGKK